MDPWIYRFDRDLTSNALLDGIERVLIGVSGGADSVALLRLFVEWRAATNVSMQLEVAHVHHGLRTEAEEDHRFVQALAESLGLPYRVVRADAAGRSRSEGLSPEAGARAVRYEAFSEWAENGDAVATAHHLDDQAETVLLRAIRGAGLRGLQGLLPRRPFPGSESVALIRPLLGWRRDEILAYLDERKQAFRTDATNFDCDVPRNAVRLEILPGLEQCQAGASRSLARLANQASRWQREWEAAAEVVLQMTRAEASPPAARGATLDAAGLRRWPRSLARLAIERAAEELSDRSAPESTASALPAPTLDEITAWIFDDRREGSIELRDGLTVDLRYGMLHLRGRGGKAAAPDADLRAPGEREGATDLAIGETRWNDWTFVLEASTEAAPTANEAMARSSDDRLCEWLDADAIVAAGGLSVRFRLPGDRFRPLGAPGTVRLKEFFRQQRVPPQQRGSVPLVVAGDRIAWVVGYRLAHGFRLRSDSQRAYTVQARPPESKK